MVRCRLTLPLVGIAVVLVTHAVASAVVVVPLGNLFDDPAGTSLADAITTDTFAAAAEPSDLGVYTVIDSDGSFYNPVTIAPGVSFDFGTAGGGYRMTGQLPGNDSVRHGTGQPGIRTTGVVDYNLPSQKIEDGVGMHANEIMTFDLAEIANAGGLPLRDMTFKVDDMGINDSTTGNELSIAFVVSDGSGNVLAGYVNGQATPIVSPGSYSEFGNPVPGPFRWDARLSGPLSIDLDDDARYLTLATLSIAVDAPSDQAVLSGARLELSEIPAPTVIAALPIGIAWLLRRRR
jgi:hypothetical protein